MSIDTRNSSENSIAFSRIKPAWADTNPVEMTAEQTALTQLRREIDLIDDQILELFERRLAIAATVGKAKDAPHGPHTKLRPDREQAVLTRMLAQAEPQNAAAVSGLWREIIGWGLARQGQLQVQVWSPNDPTRAFDGARQRFGMAASIRMVRTANEALTFAAEGRGVAVLAINNDDDWWVGLRRKWSGLSVFDGFGAGAGQPTALALGKIDPSALPKGRQVRISAGGDAGDGGGTRRWGLATNHGWTLSLTDVSHVPLEDAEGCVGAIG